MSAIVSLKSYDSQIKSHAHDHYQWVFPLRGELEINMKGIDEVVSSNRFAFIHCNQPHQFYSQHENLFLILDAPNSSSMQFHQSLVAESNSLLRKFFQFSQEYIQNPLFNSQHLTTIKNLLLDCIRMEPRFRGIKDGYSSDDKVERSKQWLDANFAENLSINRIAANVFLSSSQLQRRFLVAMGMTVGDYLRKIRLQKALDLLATTSLPINLIAEKVGYSNHSAFCRQFHLEYKMSPLMWRKMQLSAK